jgi:hypothetical protein
VPASEVLSNLYLATEDLLDHLFYSHLIMPPLVLVGESHDPAWSAAASGGTTRRRTGSRGPMQARSNV